MKCAKSAKLLALARKIAAESPEFQKVRGPGAGNKATSRFMQILREDALKAFGTNYSEAKICGDTSMAADFYFDDEQTIVEVALGLPNPLSEFEKDILKAIVAREYNHKVVSRLFFISRSGAIKKCFQPGRAALIKWAHDKHGLIIEIHELGGEPRRRHRRSRKRIG